METNQLISTESDCYLIAEDWFNATSKKEVLDWYFENQFINNWPDLFTPVDPNNNYLQSLVDDWGLIVIQHRALSA